MAKRNEKIFAASMAALVLFGFFYIQRDDSVFNFIIEYFSKVDWDEVKERDIVKNSIPITLLETLDSKCKVSAKNFDLILDHQYFVKSDELSNELNYDGENETLILPCNLIEEEKSRLEVWYVVEESPRHSMKYEYFVTAWEEPLS